MMAISFDIPYTWLLNPATNQETTIQFVEPKSERMDVDGYQTRLTVERFSAGLTQTASDAKTRLESVLTELSGMFTTFKAGGHRLGEHQQRERLLLLLHRHL